MNLVKFAVVFFITSCLSLPSSLYAAQCSAVFPDGIATHGDTVSNSKITFGFDARLVNNPDTELSTQQVNANVNSTFASCTTRYCSAASVSAEAVSVNFRQGGGSVNFNPPGGQTTTFGTTSVNNYDQVSANTNATLNFSDNHDMYFFERLAVGPDSRLNFLAGKTYYIRNFSVNSRTRINVTGAGTAKVFIASAVNFTSPVLVNSNGVNQSGDVRKLVMHVGGNVTFGNGSTFSGVLYTKDLSFISASYLFGLASGENVTLNTNSVLTYDSNAYNADFGEVCQPSIEVVQPIANLKFDETKYADIAGEIKDSIGTFHSRAKFSQPVEGKICRALDLSATGTGDYAIIDKNVLHGKKEFSVSLWEKTAKTGTQSFLSGAKTGGDNELIMWFTSDTRFTPYLSNRQNGTRTTSSIAGNTWRHLVWTHGDNKSCLFIDKVAQGCITQATSTLNIESLILGQEQDSVGGGFSSSQAFDGLLDELVIFDQVIGQQQIEQIYTYQNSGLGLNGEAVACPEIPPVEFATPIANFKFDEFEYADVAGEVIDSIGTYHSRAKLAQPVEGKVCRAIDLSTTGTRDYVVIDKDVLHNKRDFSISLWAKTPKTNNQSLLSGANSSSQNELIMWFTGHTRFTPYLQDRQNGSLSTTTIAGDTWRHLVWTHGTNKSCLFVDKVAQGCIAQATSELDIVSLILGQEQDSVGGRFDSSQAYNGLLDELVIFENVIGQEQIDQIYDFQDNGLGLDGEVISCNSELIAQYSMEEVSWRDVAGEVIDETGGFNAQGSGGATTDNATPALTGNPGTCGYGVFDGVDDYIQIDDNGNSDFALDLQSQLTVSVWINPKTLPTSGLKTIISKDENYEFHLQPSGEINWWWQTQSFSTSGAGITAGNWSHIAITYKSGKQVIYVNGIEKGSRSFSGNLILNNDPLQIGQDQGLADRFFEGFIDEVHIFKGALSATEINEIYAKRHVCAEPIIHHYEIVHDGNGLTCAAEPITIKACTNSDCSILSTEPVSLDFTVNSAVTGTSIKASPTFTGSASFTFNHYTAEPLTFSIEGASVAASNALRCSGVGASCDMTFDNAGYILTLLDHKSCTTPDLVIQAVKLSDNGISCAPAYTGDQPVNLTFNYNAPVTGTKLPDLAGSKMAGNGVAQSRVLTFDGAATAKLAFNYQDAGQIRLSVEDTSVLNLATGSVTTVVSPAQLIVKAPEVNSACSSIAPIGNCNVFKAAEEPFTLDVSATCADTSIVTPNFKLNNIPLTLTLVEPEAQTPGELGIQTVNISNGGSISLAEQTISEVGVFTITATPPPNSYFNKTIPAGTSANIGRFTPAYFKQTVNSDYTGKLHAYHSNVATCAISDWTYTGQRTDANRGSTAYSIEPKITITAYNAQNEITENYTLGAAEGFMRLQAAGVEIAPPSHDNVQLRVDNVAENFVKITSFMETGKLDFSVNDGYLVLGQMLYTFSKNDHFSYDRDDSSFLTPFSAQIPFVTQQITDQDGVTLQIDPISNEVVEDAIEKLVATGVEVRFARMVLANTYGSENVRLRAPISVEVYDGSNFSVHTDEECLTAEIKTKKTGNKYSGGMDLWDYRLIDIASDAIQVGDTEASIPSLASTFESGMLEQLFFSAPLNQGALEWEYEVPAWLKFKWDALDGEADGNFYDDNPTAILNFGLYRANDRIISWREVSN